jgi:hypothetical protein
VEGKVDFFPSSGVFNSAEMKTNDMIMHDDERASRAIPPKDANMTVKNKTETAIFVIPEVIERSLLPVRFLMFISAAPINTRHKEHQRHVGDGFDISRFFLAFIKSCLFVCIM